MPGPEVCGPGPGREDSDADRPAMAVGGVGLRVKSSGAMIPGQTAVTSAYLEHFTDRDVALLQPGDARVMPGGERAILSRADPQELNELLASQRVFEAVFATPPAGDPLLSASPFLVFAVTVHRAAAGLESVGYVSEWLGPGRRTPVFDVDELREFMSAPWHRLFLVELLSSYTHVVSGSVVISTPRGLRRQRFSELDPVRFSSLLEVVSDVERPGVLRRLGDLALFLTGVFPDYVARNGFGPIGEGRLLRAGGITKGRPEDLPREPGVAGFGDRGAVDLLEHLGRRWYQTAFELLPHPVAENVAILGELPRCFRQARRMLGLITEQFLFAHRDRWFGQS
ncbi:MAG: hypothetical protein ACLQRH_18570 [Acidimicrobiales bacterium]